jgi:hypothetical protein
LEDPFQVRENAIVGFCRVRISRSGKSGMPQRYLSTRGVRTRGARPPGPPKDGYEWSWYIVNIIIMMLST